MNTLKSAKQIRRRMRTKGYRKPERGLERQWVRCRICDWVGYYDFVPYGLGHPILTMGCACGSFNEVAENIEFGRPRG